MLTREIYVEESFNSKEKLFDYLSLFFSQYPEISIILEYHENEKKNCYSLFIKELPCSCDYCDN